MISSLNFSSPSRLYKLRSAIALALSNGMFLLSEIICEASARHSSVRSDGPSPLRTETASSTSREFPTAFPSGASISVISAATFFPDAFPILIISFASALLFSISVIKAPFPVFTSRTIDSAPAASFLLIILEAIKGMLSIVAVRSRSAYIFLSAGAISPL